MGKPNKVRKPPSAATSGKGGLWSGPVPLIAAAVCVLAVAVPLLLPYLSPPSPPSPPPTPSHAREKVTRDAKVDGRTQMSGCSEGEEDYMCSAWHKAGLCRQPKVMHKCARTCGKCEGVPGRLPPVARTDRCRRDNLSAAVPAHQLTPLFERILSDFPEYAAPIRDAGCLRAHAARHGVQRTTRHHASVIRPIRRRRRRRRSAINTWENARPCRYEPEALSTSPYVLLLKNVVTPDEAGAFAHVCKEKFERSLAGDQLNPVRMRRSS
jgi:hypothetical protein